jgi:hypothetical protein
MPLRIGGGLIEMGEDRIERAHQLRERDRQRHSPLRNIQMMKALQAKFQNLRMDPTIKSVQAEEQSKARRNLKRGRSLKEENDDAKRVARNEERVTVFDEVVAQDAIALPQARAGKHRKLRDHLKRQTERHIEFNFQLSELTHVVMLITGALNLTFNF